MPNPILNLMEVEEILQPLKSNKIEANKTSAFNEKCLSIRRNREQEDVRTIRRVLKLPQNVLP